MTCMYKVTVDDVIRTFMQNCVVTVRGLKGALWEIGKTKRK